MRSILWWGGCVVFILFVLFFTKVTEDWPLAKTFRDLYARKEFNIEKSLPVISYLERLSSNPLCHTFSMAFVNSKHKDLEMDMLSRDALILSEMVVFFSVDCTPSKALRTSTTDRPDRNSYNYWYSLSSSWRVRYLWILRYKCSQIKTK